MTSSEGAKQGIILIVEGKIDRIALEGYLESVFPTCVIKTYVYGGDLTCGIDGDRNEIEPDKEVNRIAQEVMHRNGWQTHDVIKVVQITDTDGAYVDDSYVIKDTKIADKTLCTEKALLSKNPKGTIKRNRYKRKYTLELQQQSELRQMNISYELYYMSTNLEHVIRGDCCRYTPQEKSVFAREFRSECFKDDEYASRTFFDDELADKTFEESWSFIMSNGHALGKHTNLGLLSARSGSGRSAQDHQS